MAVPKQLPLPKQRRLELVQPLELARQKAVKTYISNLTKIDKDVLLLFTGKSAAERPGARPKRDSESALAAGRAGGEDRYFHEGHHNLSGLGPGFMIVMLGLAAADGPGAASSPVPAGCCGPASSGPGQRAGGAASLLRIEDSETGSGSDSEFEPPADQDHDLPEQERAQSLSITFSRSW